MAGSSSAVKKPNSKAYLSVMVLYGCGRVAALAPKLFIWRRPASELCRLRHPIGLKSAFYPESDRFIGDELRLLPRWEHSGWHSANLATDAPFLMQW